MAVRSTPAREEAHDARQEMRDEARRLVDAARADGVTLRLLGGLGVREHCRTPAFCERDYSDLDLVAAAGQVRLVGAFMEGAGFAERVDVRIATQNEQLQFTRACIHGGREQPPAHADDHVDIFLGTLRMGHDIALGERLSIETYTVSVSDLLLTKLQVFKLNEKDLRDIVSLLKDLGVANDDRQGVINVGYIAGLCADDWGLFYDVATNLQRAGDRLPVFGLNAAEVEHARRGIASLIGAIDAAPKSFRWRLRAKVGTRVSWHREVEDQG